MSMVYAHATLMKNALSGPVSSLVLHSIAVPVCSVVVILRLPSVLPSSDSQIPRAVRVRPTACVVRQKKPASRLCRTRPAMLSASSYRARAAGRLPGWCSGTARLPSRFRAWNTALPLPCSRTLLRWSPHPWLRVPESEALLFCSSAFPSPRVRARKVSWSPGSPSRDHIPQANSASDALTAGAACARHQRLSLAGGAAGCRGVGKGGGSERV